MNIDVQPTIHPFPEHIMTSQELKEYVSLRDRIIGNNSFVEVDFSNPDHMRLNVLAMKYMNLRKYINDIH